MEFICDDCGSIVSLQDKQCPHCQAIFAKVRCPECGFSGQSNMFKNGCPMCHYQVMVTQPFSKEDTKAYWAERGADRRKRNFWIFLLSLLALNAVMFIYVGSNW